MTVVVTGAAGAIGGAVVRAFAATRERVIAQDLREPLFEEGNVVPIEGDLRDRTCLGLIRDVVGDDGAIAVVAAHGIFSGSGPLATLERESTRRLIDVNFAVLPALLDTMSASLRVTGGTFVAVASQAALRGEPDNSVYAAAKWAVRAWATTADEQLRSDGIRVRSMCPGRTHSPLLQDALTTFSKAAGMTRDEYEAHCLSLVPAGSFGTPESIAAGVLYLASSQPRPGVLAVNGGEVPW